MIGTIVDFEGGCIELLIFIDGDSLSNAVLGVLRAGGLLCTSGRVW